MCEIDVVKYVYLIKNVNLLNIYYLYKINFCKKKKKKKLEVVKADTNRLVKGTPTCVKKIDVVKYVYLIIKNES
jgi:hypothetical protein